MRLLSFGSSRGDEVASLRRYFPLASIKGVDISRADIKECRRRRDLADDPGVELAQASGARGEPPSHYDAIFCTTVFRHGDLTGKRRQSCADLISFEAFERTVAELAICLRSGGLLVTEHSNFRFEDTYVKSRSSASGAAPVPTGNKNVHPCLALTTWRSPRPRRSAPFFESGPRRALFSPRGVIVGLPIFPRSTTREPRVQSLQRRPVKLFR